MLMSPDSSYTLPCSSTGPMMVSSSSNNNSNNSSPSNIHPVLMIAPSSSTTPSMSAPINLQKYNKPTAIATAVIQVQVPKGKSNGMILSPHQSSLSLPPLFVGPHPLPPQQSSSSSMTSLSTSTMPGYSNVIVMNKKAKGQPDQNGGSGCATEYGRCPAMEATSTFKGEADLNIGTRKSIVFETWKWKGSRKIKQEPEDGESYTFAESGGFFTLPFENESSELQIPTYSHLCRVLPRDQWSKKVKRNFVHDCSEELGFLKLHFDLTPASSRPCRYSKCWDGE